MSDDSDFSVNGDDLTGPLSDSGNHSNSADPTVPDPHARSRRFDFRGKIGNFLIHREIGRGGMGIVYEAIEEILNRRVALKVLPSGALIDEMQIRRFRNEAAAAAQLAHPNIVSVYSVGSDRGVHYYAMQLIDGQSIAEVIGSIRERISTQDKDKHHADTPRDIGTTQRATEAPSPATKGPKDASSRKQLMEDDFAAAVSHHRHPQSCQRLFKSIAAIGCDAARAIHYAHEAGIVHRDIKPHNLMLDDKGKIWITDFGLAQVRDNPIGTRTGDILGTLKYMSPEQASGRKFLIDHRTDIYSLGVTLYELLTLQPAHSGVGAKEILRQISFEDPQSLRLINPRIPAELETIISKAIAKNPQERYVTAAEFADDLERFCNDQPIAARRPTGIQKVRRWVAKNPTMAGMIGIGMVFAFITSLGITGAALNSRRAIFVEHKKTISLLSKSEGWRLLTNARAVLPENPGLSLALAAESSIRVDGREVNSALQAAWDVNHELKLLTPHPMVTDCVSLASRSQRVVTTVGREAFGKGNFPAVITDLQNANVVGVLDCDEAITSAAFSPNENFILTASCGIRPSSESDEELKRVNPAVLWDAATRQKLHVFAKNPILKACPEMFSPGNELVVLSGPDNDSTVYGTALFDRKFALRGHPHPVVQCLFSPNGQLIATVDTHGEIRIWNSKDGAPLKTIEPPAQLKRPLVHFSFNSQFILLSSSVGTRSYSTDAAAQAQVAYWHEPNTVASPSQHQCASFWNSSSGVLVRDFRTGDLNYEIATPAGITGVCYSANGEQLAVGGKESVAVHDAASGKLLYELKGHTAPITAIVFNKSTRTLITASKDSTMRIWSQESSADRQRFATPADGLGVDNPSFSSDSQYLLSASSNYSQTLMFDLEGRRINGEISGEIRSKAFTNSGIAVVDGSVVSEIDPVNSRALHSRDFVGYDIAETVPISNHNAMLLIVRSGTSLFWNLASNETVPLSQQGDRIAGYSSSKDGKFFVTGTANGKCQVHDSMTGRVIRTIRHTAAVVSVGFMPDQTRILTVDDLNTIRIWGKDDDIPEKLIRKTESKFTNCIPTSDSRFLVAYHETEAQTVHCFDANSGEVAGQTEGAELMKLILHPTQSGVYLASRRDGLKYWNYETGQTVPISTNPVTEIREVKQRLFSIEHPPGTERVNSILQPQDITAFLRVYSTTDNKMLNQIPATFGSFGDQICVDEEKQEIAATTTVYSVTVCDRVGPRTINRIGSHFAPISFASFLGDTRGAITASWDGTAKIWSKAQGLIHTLNANRGAVTYGAITRDGSTAALGYIDGSIVLWNTSDGQQLSTLTAGEKAIASLAFSPDGRSIVSTDSAGVGRYWNLLSRSFDEVKFEVSALSLSADGHWGLCLSKSPSQTAALFNLKSKSLVPVATNKNIVAGTFSNTTNQFALADISGTTTIYEVKKDASIQAITELSSGELLNKIAFSPNDDVLAMSTVNGLSLWNVDTKEKFHEVKPKARPLISGHPNANRLWTPFSNDSRWMAVATNTATSTVAVSPIDVSAEQARPLQNAEKELYRVGLADLQADQTN
jgi:WD40 repeat protein/serine/threonine protein kinase